MNGLQHDDVRPLPNVVWNLFLAVVPVLLAFLAARQIRTRLSTGLPAITFPILLLIFAWACFLPNTCYLLTEWRHYIRGIAQGVFPDVRYGRIELPLLAATVFYIWYTGSGLIAFFLSVWPLDRIIRERAPRWADLLRLLVFAFCALGVYLGLVPRYNSWQLISPHHLPEILRTVSSLVMRPFVLTSMVAFAFLLWLLYVAFDIWMDGLCLRLSRRSAASVRSR